MPRPDLNARLSDIAWLMHLEIEALPDSDEAARLDRLVSELASLVNPLLPAYPPLDHPVGPPLRLVGATKEDDDA